MASSASNSESFTQEDCDDDIIARAQTDTLAWDDTIGCSLADITLLLKMDIESKELSKLIEDTFQLVDCTTNIKSCIIRDFYTDAVFFSQQHELDPQSASAFLKLMHLLLRSCKDGMELSDAVTHFSNIMRNHASTVSDTDNEEKHVDFPPRIVGDVVKFVATGMFQHYRMYQNLFDGKAFTVIQTVLPVIRVPLVSRSLNEARMEVIQPEPDLSGITANEIDQLTQEIIDAYSGDLDTMVSEKFADHTSMANKVLSAKK